MVPEFIGYVLDALKSVKSEPASRENSLVVTKLEEAMMWWERGQKERATPRSQK